MNAVLLGPPGAGKGTLAAVLKKDYGLLHISTGDLLREEMKSGTELGKKIKNFVESGELVPDRIVIEMIEQTLEKSGSQVKGYMLDGFPRTTVQAEDLDRILAKIGKPIDVAILMEASLPVILQRLTGRRLCRNCGTIFHVQNKPSRQPGICDACGGDLYQRPDDTEETIKNRMLVYAEKTAPIIEFYEKQGKLRKVPCDSDTQTIVNVVNNILRNWDDGRTEHKNQIPG